uniref:hypothetical protein n=1 Tax=Burkholderia arboris TaxID=488730 RepID=UPI003BEEF3CA
MKFPSTTAALRAAAASATRTGVIHTHHIHQVLEALPAGARLPMHLIVKRTGLPPHVVHPIVEALVSEARLQPVRVTTPGNVSRRFYARPVEAAGCAAVANSDVGKALLAALSLDRIYEMYQIAKMVGVKNAAVRAHVFALVESGHLIVTTKKRGNRTSALYQLAQTAPIGGTVATAKVTVPTLTPTETRAPKATAVDVFNVMKPKVGYRVTTLAQTLGLSIRRTTELLAVLQRDGRVVRVMLTESRVPQPAYYVSGTEPRAPVPPATVLATLWAERPTFDDEYGRSLRALREIAEASR